MHLSLGRQILSNKEEKTSFHLGNDDRSRLLRDKGERAFSILGTQASSVETARETTVPESRGHELSEVIGQAVLRHRKAAGLTRGELSELAGVGATAIFQIENGHPTVKLETLVSVLDVLNIKLQLRSSLEGEIS